MNTKTAFCEVQVKEISNTDPPLLWVSFLSNNDNIEVPIPITHSRSELLPNVVASFNDLKNKTDSDEYLDLAQQEISYAISNTNDNRLAEELEYVYQTINMAKGK